MFLGRRGNSRAGSIPVVRIIVNESLRVPCWNERRFFIRNKSDEKIIIVRNNIKKWKDGKGTLFLGLKEFLVDPYSIKA